MHPLDRLDALLAGKGAAAIPPALHLGTISSVSGIIEFLALRWAWLNATGNDLLDRPPQREPSALFHAVCNHPAVIAAFGPPRHTGFWQDAGRAEICLVPPPGPAWQAGTGFALFQEHFKDALRAHGHAVDGAFLLAAGLTEMASNAVEHAMAAVSPLAAYRVDADDWEFSVTDVGCGVLISMRSNPEFVNLPNAVDALRYALTDGVSSTGEPGRGCGFSTLFKALVDRDCSLRLRSAGACAWWSGRSPTDQTLRFQLLPDRRGFHISVSGSTPQAISTRAT